MMPASKAGSDARDELIDRLSWGLTVLAVMVGAAIIGCHIESGSKRWVAAAWQFALQVPGSPGTWGAVIITAGLLMLYGQLKAARRAFRYGCAIAYGWFIILCATSFLAFLTDPVVNPLAPLTWGAIAFAYGLLFKLTRKQKA